MEQTTDKARLIREEFECFVRIGMDGRLRGRVRKALEQRLIAGTSFIAMPAIYFELRDADGSIREMWYLDADSSQQLRLLEFLTRFSLDDVRLIDGMLHR